MPAATAARPSTVREESSVVGSMLAAGWVLGFVMKGVDGEDGDGPFEQVALDWLLCAGVYLYPGLVVTNKT